jgi:hypothetical protein
MASATSKQAKPNVGTTPTIIQSKVTEIGKSTDGNRQFNTEIQKVEGGTTTTIGTMDAAGKVTPAATANAAEKTALADVNSPLRKEVTKQITDSTVVKDLGVTTEQDKKALNTATGSGAAKNTAPTNPENKKDPPAATQAQKDDVNKENASFRSGTRLSYAQDMKYPLDLKSELQDVIKFSILEYSPSLSKENQQTSPTGQFGSSKSRSVELKGGGVKGSKIIGVITLPIPARIGDSNTVDWGSAPLNPLEEALAELAQGFFDGGVEGAGKSLDKKGKDIQGAIKSGDLSASIKSIFLGSAVNASAAKRAYGSVINNNVEVLFNGPGLRSHSFSFLFYPRDPKEAIMVRQIIRAFKQSMSVKRSESSLLLKPPHTFAIQYMTSGQKAHPYLTRFKECALTSCNVDYTPDGTYMTYGGDEKSMTAYSMGLTFSELEPIFDDEYGKNDDNVGF